MALKMSTEIFDLIYPIGSIYLCTHDTNPSVLFGGTWQKMSGGYLYGCSSSVGNSTYTGDKTQSHTLTISEMPSHKHNFETYTGETIGCYDNGGNSGLAIKQKGWVYGSCKITETGGGQGHTHDIAYIGVWVWKRIG